MKCRNCNKKLEKIFVDLGHAPPSNAYLNKNEILEPEILYPLKTMVCQNCWLVQTIDFRSSNELFRSDYAYFSSASTTWLEHAKKYSEKIIKKLSLSEQSFVIEVASNDGYLLKNFVEKGIPCIGIEPTDSAADYAEKIGVKVEREFYGSKYAKKLLKKYTKADLIIGNNVFAHVPDIVDFTRALKTSLKHNGIITLEFPHLLQLIKCKQFDTIYHEHFSYLSLNVVNNLLEKNGLTIIDVEKLNTHGGSLRVYASHAENIKLINKSVQLVLKEEEKFGLCDIKIYEKLNNEICKIKNNLLKFLIKIKEEEKIIVGYGAAAKGNTILNYAGIKEDLLPIIFDASPSKQYKYMPGSHIKILPPEQMEKLKPDYILILPWNLAYEIHENYKHLEKSGTEFYVAIPEIKKL